jgi:hypothetical protein
MEERAVVMWSFTFVLAGSVNSFLGRPTKFSTVWEPSPERMPILPAEVSSVA